MLALLRTILTEGKVLFDGTDIASLNLDALRSSVTIIPQVVSSVHKVYSIKLTGAAGASQRYLERKLGSVQRVR